MSDEPRRIRRRMDLKRRQEIGRADKPKVTERQMSEWVRKAAQVTGYLAYHTWNSMHSAPGFPDWCLVHPKRHRIIFIELKTATGKVTVKQAEWIEALTDVAAATDRVKVWIVRPDDLDDLFEELKK